MNPAVSKKQTGGLTVLVLLILWYEKITENIFADQQDSETTNLVRQHQEALREAQEGMKEKTTELEAVSQDYNNKLQVEMNESHVATFLIFHLSTTDFKTNSKCSL